MPTPIPHVHFGTCACFEKSFELALTFPGILRTSSEFTSLGSIEVIDRYAFETEGFVWAAIDSPIFRPGHWRFAFFRYPLTQEISALDWKVYTELYVYEPPDETAPGPFGIGEMFIRRLGINFNGAGEKEFGIVEGPNVQAPNLGLPAGPNPGQFKRRAHLTPNFDKHYKLPPGLSGRRFFMRFILGVRNGAGSLNDGVSAGFYAEGETC